MNCDEFINKIFEIKNSEDAVLDFIYDSFNDYMHEKQFDLCGEILSKLDINNCNITILLGFLTITLPAKSKIMGRNEFYNKVYSELIKRKENIYILKGLE